MSQAPLPCFYPPMGETEARGGVLDLDASVPRLRPPHARKWWEQEVRGGGETERGWQLLP